MKTIRSLWQPSLILFAALGSGILGWLFLRSHQVRLRGEDHDVTWDAKIDALANRNPIPKLVEKDHETFPVFAANYDWNEDHRVREILSELRGNASPELWERLIAHFADNRYALTMRYDEGDPQVYSVGDLCHLMAAGRLTFASTWKSEPGSEDPPDIWLDLGLDDIPKWRRQRSQKSLYALQVEICETAVREISIAPNLSNSVKARIGTELNAMLHELKGTKTPFSFLEVSMDGYDFFDAESGQDARKLANTR
jgi:hypothetical protein